MLILSASARRPLWLPHTDQKKKVQVMVADRGKFCQTSQFQVRDRQFHFAMAANVRSASRPSKSQDQKSPKQGKTEIRQQKRKRDHESLQALQQRVDDLVGFHQDPLPIFRRNAN